MKLLLAALPKTLRGIYGASKDRLGAHQLLGHPDMKAGIVKMEADGFHLAYSDLFRSAESSLARRKEFEARGGPQLAKRPGESPHNFGLAIDIDVPYALKTYSLNKLRLDEFLASYGFCCHRPDHLLGAESWHFNYLGADRAKWLAFASTSSTSRAIEAKIQALYGAQMVLTKEEVTAALVALKYATVKDFQEDWDLAADGIAGKNTQRLLAFLTAEKVLA